MTHRNLRVALSVMFLLFVAPPARGQTSDPPPKKNPIEEIIVVGTAIQRTPIDSPYAVSVVDREALEQQGSPLMVDLFKNLGVSHGVVGERSSWYNSSQSGTIPESVSNVNLRGLGASRTLVLINGRRQVYLPARLIGGRFVDLNAIPSIALGRLEVLKEGASAIYGSDAVGGIANFVTREDFEGFELTVSHDNFDDANDTMLGGIWGGALGDSHAVVAVEHERRRELKAEDRSWALRPLLDPWRAAWSSVGNPGHFWFPTESLDAAAIPKEDFFSEIGDRSGKNDPRCREFGGDPQSYSCLFNYQPWDNLIEETRNTRAFAELNGPWGDRVRYHIEALWAESVTPNFGTQPSYPPFPQLTKGVMEIGAGHPGRMEFCDRYGGAGGAFADECAGSDHWYFRGRPFGNGSTGRFLRRESRTWRVAASVEGDFDAFGGRELHYDVGVTYSRGKSNLNVPGVFIERLFLAYRGYGGPSCGVGVVADDTRAPGMRLGPTAGKTPGADGCLYYNPFSNAVRFSGLPGAPFDGQPNPDYRPALANDPGLTRWLNGEVDLESETELLVADFTLSGSLIEDVLGFAVGYQLRRFDASGDPNDHGDITVNPCPVLGDTNCSPENRFGPYTWTNMHNPYDEDQTVHRVFGELAANLGERLDVQAAVNYERYDEASSVDPKLSLRWRFMDSLILRGSVQTTFRTPSVDDLTEDVPLTTLEYITQVGTWIPVDRYGDTDLDPEQAFTYNLGMIAFLGSDIEMTVDYWSYDFEDVIGGLPQDTLASFYADPEKRDSVKQYIHCTSGRADQPGASCKPNEIIRVGFPLVNWPGVETSGIDWQMSGQFDVGPGSLVASLSGTYTLDYDIRELSLDGFLIQEKTNVAGQLNFGNPLVAPIPDWKARASLAYHWNDYSLMGYLNYISSYKDVKRNDGFGGIVLDDFTIDDFTTLDLVFQWRLPDLGLNVTLSALNLTDEDPPFANVEHAYDGFTHNPKGRRWKVALSYRF